MNKYDATEIAFKNGYKKAVEEIFEEIEKILDKKFSINHGVVLISKEDFAELKKKYTENKQRKAVRGDG